MEIESAATDLTLLVADATRLEASLELALALRALGRPMVLALNRMDEVARQGRAIDVGVLQQGLGIRVVPMMTVVLEHRATTGNVVDDRVETFRSEGRAILIGKLAGRFARPAMEVNRTAADLVLWHVDVAAIVLQYAGGGPVHVPEQRVAGAAEEQADRGAALANRGQEFRQRPFIPLRRR